jgi:hypothetical protein
MHSCLELSPVDEDLLPNKSMHSQLIEMMVEVQSESQNVNTIGKFVTALKDMLGNLVATQRRHELIHQKMMAQCLEEDQFRAKEVAAAKRAVGRAAAARARCSASLKAAVKALPLLVSNLRTYENELTRATNSRNHERQKYLMRRQEFAEAIAFVNNFVAMVHRALRGKMRAFSFVDMAETLIKHSNKLNLLSEAALVLTQLPRANRYGVNSNQGLGQRLKLALNSLVNRLRQDNAANESAERAAVNAFVRYSSRINKVIATLKRNIARVRKQIADMTRCITMEGKIMAVGTAKLARNSNLRTQARNMCASFNKEFIEATFNRRDEIKTMGEIITIVMRRFKRLPKDLVTYLESVQNGFRTYVNSTQFRRFLEYRRVVYAQNHRGRLLASVNADNARHNMI